MWLWGGIKRCISTEGDRKVMTQLSCEPKVPPKLFSRQTCFQVKIIVCVSLYLLLLIGVWRYKSHELLKYDIRNLFLYFLTLHKQNNNTDSHVLLDLSGRGNNKTLVISQDTSVLLLPSVDSPLLHNSCKTVNNDESRVIRSSGSRQQNLPQNTEAVKNQDNDPQPSTGRDDHCTSSSTFSTLLLHFTVAHIHRLINRFAAPAPS